MRIVKAIVAVVLLAAAGTYIRRVLFEQYRCGVVVTKEVLDGTRLLGGISDSALVSIRARENLAKLAPCLEHTPWNVRLHMLAGGNHAFRDEHALAVAAYSRALEYDRRPEIYFAIGDQLLHLGRTNEAIEQLVAACVIHPHWIARIPEPVRHRVRERVEAIRSHY